MKIQYQQQLDELQEALNKPGIRAENNAAKILRGIMNTNDEKFIKEGLSAVCFHKDLPSKKNLNEAIVQIMLRPIKDKKGAFEDWAFFRVMCEGENWSFFHWAGYSINSFTDSELEKFINSKEMVKIEEFSATILKYLLKSSEIIELRNSRFDYEWESEMPEHEIILGWEISNHDEAERICSISDALLASYPHNEKIQKDNEEIWRYLKGLRTECRELYEKRNIEKQKWETAERERELEGYIREEEERKRKEEEWEREAEEERREAEERKRQQAEIQRRLKVEQEKERQKEINIKILKIFGWISLFGIPMAVLHSWMGANGIFLYFVLLFFIGGFIVWWRTRQGWVVQYVQPVLIGAVIAVWITYIEYMNKPEIRNEQQTGLSCDWQTTEQYVSIFSKPNHASKNSIARMPASKTCVQETGQTQYYIKVIVKNDNGETITGYVKKSQLRKSN